MMNNNDLNHDANCPGCKSGVMAIDDYIERCAHCGKSIQGGRERRVGSKAYHDHCVIVLSK